VADRVSITSGALTAEIAHRGAELQSLKDEGGRELMSDGDPAYWRGRAPLLFPIVGRLNEDTLRLDRQSYTMEKHGFARRSRFALVDQGEAQVCFRLTDTPETRAMYPFAFALDAEFRLEGATLHMTVTVRNTGDMPLPASFGYHPAFAWPLPFGGGRGEHRIRFESDEPARLCAITMDGLIDKKTVPSPVVGNVFRLTDAQFENDALVWKDLASRRLTYGAPGYPSLDIAFPDTPWLGIWTKPGAGFVCVEPWAGMADPQGYAGDFRDKPGVFEIAPGGERQFRMDVTLNY
jgi:galactose mutarotase-like enzyme